VPSGSTWVLSATDSPGGRPQSVSTTSRSNYFRFEANLRRMRREAETADVLFAPQSLIVLDVLVYKVSPHSPKPEILASVCSLSRRQLLVVYRDERGRGGKLVLSSVFLSEVSLVRLRSRKLKVITYPSAFPFSLSLTFFCSTTAATASLRFSLVFLPQSVEIFLAANDIRFNWSAVGCNRGVLSSPPTHHRCVLASNLFRLQKISDCVLHSRTGYV